MEITITAESKRVFEAYAQDAVNWNGTPLVGGNVGGSKEERGNLTQLKKAGLITTENNGIDLWVEFTDAGREYAASLGISGFSCSTQACSHNDPQPNCPVHDADGRYAAELKALGWEEPDAALDIDMRGVEE